MLTTTTPPISASLSPGYVQVHFEKLRRRANERRAPQPNPQENHMSDEPMRNKIAAGKAAAAQLTQAQLLELYGRHVGSEHAAGETVAVLAAEIGVSAPTLATRWKHLGLEVVKSRKSRRSAMADALPPEPEVGPFNLADYGYEEGSGREECRKPEDVEKATPDLGGNDAWFERVRRAHPGDDALDALFAGDEIVHNIAVTAIEDPRGLEPIWQRANGHRPADDLTIDDFMSPPVAAIAAWVGRLRAVREELKEMGVTVEGRLSVTFDL